MFSILNHALSWAITIFGNKFCLKKRPKLIKALNNRFYVKFLQLEIGLFRMNFLINAAFEHLRMRLLLWAVYISFFPLSYFTLTPSQKPRRRTFDGEIHLRTIRNDFARCVTSESWFVVCSDFKFTVLSRFQLSLASGIYYPKT